MRKIVALFGLLLLPSFWAGWGMSCFSQNQNLNQAISYFDDYLKYNEMKSLPLAKEKIDLAAANENTSAKYKTWFYRGQIYLAIFDQALKAEMNKSAETDINKKILSAYNLISMADVEEALRSFQKGTELDEKKIYANDTKAKIRVIVSHYSDKAYACIRNLNYADALTYYEKSYEMKLKLAIVDTIEVKYMAIAASKLKNYKKAEEKYNQLIEMKYKPENSYIAIMQMYDEAGDTAAYRMSLAKAREAMPESNIFILDEINYYLNPQKGANPQKAINSLTQGISKDPNNAELHLALGGAYSNLAFPKDKNNKDLPKPSNWIELTDKAETAYQRSIEIRPDAFIGYFQLGIVYYNMGASIVNQAQTIKDQKKYKAEEDKADVLFKKAIPLLEKAHELDPGDQDTMKTLRQLYARTGQGETEKYKKLNEELKKQ